MPNPCKLWDHLERGAAWSLNYFSGNVASTKAAADRVKLTIAGGFPELNFALPAEASALQMTIYALENVFESGKRARSREIAALLKVE